MKYFGLETDDKGNPKDADSTKCNTVFPRKQRLVLVTPVICNCIFELIIPLSIMIYRQRKLRNLQLNQANQSSKLLKTVQDK